jgi:hypothetical protein
MQERAIYLVEPCKGQIGRIKELGHQLQVADQNGDQPIVIEKSPDAVSKGRASPLKSGGEANSLFR